MSIDLNDPRARQMFLANMSEQPTTSQMQQPQAQGPNSLAEFTRLLGGDLSGSLTGGDKLLALSALMRSATRSGRRAGLTPQQVMGQLQQQKVAEVQNRMAVEQMRAKMAQEQRQEQAMAQFVSTLPAELQARFPALDAEGKQAVLREYTTLQPFQIVKSGGESFMTFRNKDIPPVKLDIPRDVETREIDTGATIRIVDKNTGEVIQEYPKEMSPYQAGQLAVAQGNLAVRQAEFERGPPSGGDGKIKTVVYEVEGAEKPLYAQGQDIGGGFVRVTSGRHAGLIMKRASANKDWQREEIGRQLREELGS